MRGYPMRNMENAIDITGEADILLALHRTVQEMKPGEICVYHRSTQEYVAAVLDAAWNYHQEGVVKLMQRKFISREGANFEYLAVKTSQPKFDKGAD